jgi:hypothetical protein
MRLHRSRDIPLLRIRLPVSAVRSNPAQLCFEYLGPFTPKVNQKHRSVRGLSIQGS